MIKTWSLENFKSVYESTSLDLSPLTIFTGANSSGKSTVLQSILLTTQTIQNSIPSKSVILNGHIIKLGTFNDILSNNAQSKMISIGFELIGDPNESRNRFFSQKLDKNFLVKNKFNFSSRNLEDANDITQLHPELISSELHIEQENNQEVDDIKGKIQIKRSNESIEDRKVKLKIEESEINNEEFLEYEVIMDGTAKLYSYNSLISEKPVGAKMFHFLPAELSIVFEEIHQNARQLVSLFIDTDNNFRYYNWRSSKFEFNNKFIELIMNEISSINLEINKIKRMPRLREINRNYETLKVDFNIENFVRYIRFLPEKYTKAFEIQIKQKETKLYDAIVAGQKPRFELAEAALPDNLELGFNHVKKFFSRNVKYLGPLRDEPKPIYPHSGTTDSRDVGFKGEHTAAVLEIHKNTYVSHISPNDLLQKGVNEPKLVPLIEAVLEWLEYMGVVKDVETIDRGKLGHELKVIIEGGSVFHDLTNVGVGVSQVLPILVLSLLAEKGSTLIFEQPELHLHPKVQTRLADFFVSMMQLKKQCIVESHSEYIINRLRYRSVVTDDEYISKNVMIYFVEKNMGKSQYNQVRINKYGVIEEWPKGFFDENEENSAAILRAAMNKRKKERNH